jgi:DNA transformation protein and related proteins
MAPSAQYKQYVLELLQPTGSIRTRGFFGGVGIYRDAVQFAMMMGNSLYFVVNDTTRPAYERVGMQAFSYLTKNGRVQVRKYFQVPEEVMTDPQQLRQWADMALLSAKNAQMKKT